MEWHKGIPDADWDKALFQNGGHFLQSSHWAAFQTALDHPVFYAHGTDWRCLAILEKSRTGRRLYCPYGPTAQTAKALNNAFKALHLLARQHRAMFVRVEPILPAVRVGLASAGLKPALKDIQPAQTWVQRLTKSVDELLADFTPTNRNLYRNAAKKGLTFRASSDPTDITIFLKMIHDVAANTGMQPHSDNYYRTMAKVLLPRNAAHLYIADHHDKPVGAAIVFDSPTTRYYAHAGNLITARKLHPGSPLLATMMFDAKKRKQTTFDFVGVAPMGQDNHPWSGFSQFKKSFGGEYLAYRGTWELPAHPLYRLYRGVYQAHKQLRLK
ncbi:MAG TPA: peptidoglycan bridge formation glycyltransferase FemA/FemB family protein [Magnetospirillaceae bacterium]|nr:peptidoglycan bridge formation glycyltransferase FemA/FemB family protein [Magnetospirillaceae bacterium]